MAATKTFTLLHLCTSAYTHNSNSQTGHRSSSSPRSTAIQYVFVFVCVIEDSPIADRRRVARVLLTLSALYSPVRSPGPNWNFVWTAATTRSERVCPTTRSSDPKQLGKAKGITHVGALYNGWGALIRGRLARFCYIYSRARACKRGVRD